MRIGYKIKKLRELRNFTQSYMATALQITQSTYCRYENNELDVSEKMLTELSNILTISPQAIVNFEEEKLFEYIEMMTKFNHYHTNKEIELYEALIHSLKNENKHLQDAIQSLRQTLDLHTQSSA